MEINDYQRAAHDTAEGYADVLNEDIDDEIKALFLITALNGEVGEVSEKVKKGVRESEHPLEEGGYFAEAEDEIGDVLWYLAQLSSLLDVWLDDVAQQNLDKLESRDERGVLFGDGDSR